MVAHVAPKPFPVSKVLSYPKVDKKGVDNPIYFTSSSSIGIYPPNEHQLPDRYFPKSNKFSQSFAHNSKRSAGLVTMACKSSVHSSLDEGY